MAKVERFEDLSVWQTSRKVVSVIYDVTAVGVFSRDFSLRDQIRRAAVSVPSNIAEGFSRHSNKEFIQYLFISKGSAAEAQSQLYVALDQEYVSQEQFDEIYNQLETVAKQISRFITYLRDAG
ncbi:four helix bundle protein [Candidatus Bipolaricaulota bacterium]